jgi:DNA polymerase-3 subunit alpha
MARLATQAAQSASNGTGSGGTANLLNKTTLESLIKCGAMDSLHEPDGRSLRAAMTASLEAAMGSAQKVAQDKAAGQGGLFMGGGAAATKEAAAAKAASLLAKASPWSESETLAKEREILGFYVSSHPLEEWSAWTKVFVTGGCDAAKALPHDSRVVLAGLVGSVRTLIVKTGRSAGQKMAIVPMEDQSGSIEVVLFADRYAQFADTVQPGNPVFVVGRIDRSRAGITPAGGANATSDEDPGAQGGKPGGGGSGGQQNNVQVIVDRVVPIDGVPLMPGKLWVRLDAERLNGDGSQKLKELAAIVRGESLGGGDERLSGGATGPSLSAEDRATAFPMDLVVDLPDQRIRLESSPHLRVRLTAAMVGELTHKLGEGCVRVVGGVTVETMNGRGGGGGGKPWMKKGAAGAGAKR